MKTARIVGGWLAMSISVAAHAADPLPLKEICREEAGQRSVDPMLLQYYALRGVNPLTLDRDRNGTTPDEIFAALTDPDYCGPDGKACPEGEEQKLRDARNILASFEQEHPGVDIQVKRTPTPLELAAQPGLADRHNWLADPARRFVTMLCQAPEEPAAPDIAAGGEPRLRLNLGTFLLTKDVGGLTTPRGPKGQRNRLKNVPQAEISFVDDDVKDVETFAISATAGLNVMDNDAVTLIPFVQLVRSHVESTNGGADKDTGKVAAGALLSALVTPNDQIEFASLYTKDLESDAEILSGRFAWRPGFLYSLSSFRGDWRFGCSAADLSRGSCRYGTHYFGFRSDLQLVTTFGKILHEGTDSELTDGREFLRSGVDTRFVLYGLRGIVRDFSVDIAFKHLVGIVGDGDDITQFRAGISYWIAGSDHVALRYGYERGRDEDTLEKFDLWKLALGVRF